MNRYRKMIGKLCTRQLYVGGASVAEIAKAQHLSKSAVYSRLRKLGILLRDRDRKAKT